MSYDWAAVETEYITSDISLRDIAKKYDISFSTVCHRSKENKWVKKKKEHKSKVVAKALQKSANSEAKKLKKLQECSDELDEMIKAFMKANKKAKQYMSAMDLSLLSKSLKDAVNIKRDVYNILTPAQQEKMQIEREKFELEKQKSQSDKTDNKITVVFEGNIEEYSQ